MCLLTSTSVWWLLFWLQTLKYPRFSLGRILVTSHKNMKDCMETIVHLNSCADLTHTKGPIPKIRCQMGHDYGSSGRAVTSDTKKPQFELGHHQFLSTMLVLTVEKMKEAGNGPFKNAHGFWWTDIAQQICPHSPFRGPFSIYRLLYYICHCIHKGTKINKKRQEMCH